MVVVLWITRIFINNDEQVQKEVNVTNNKTMEVSMIMKKHIASIAAVTCLGFSVLASHVLGAAGTIEFTNPSSTNKGYNREGAAKYAVDHAPLDKRNTRYANYGSNSDGGDCTNFASQVLHEGGGLAFHGTKGKNDFIKDWYYYGSDIPPAKKPRTSTWTGAHQFRKHWGVVDGSGGKNVYQMKKYTMEEAYKNFKEIYSDLWKGDIVQYMDKNGHTYHSQVVWKYGTGIMNVAQHSTNDGYWGWALDLETEIKNRKSGGGWFVTLRVKESGN